MALQSIRFNRTILTVKLIMKLITKLLFLFLLSNINLSWADKIDSATSVVIFNYIGKNYSDDHLFHLMDRTTSIERRLEFKELFSENFPMNKDVDSYKAIFLDKVLNEKVVVVFFITNINGSLQVIGSEINQEYSDVSKNLVNPQDIETVSIEALGNNFPSQTQYEINEALKKIRKEE